MSVKIVGLLEAILGSNKGLAIFDIVVFFSLTV